jgi:hypothetical protein
MKPSLFIGSSLAAVVLVASLACWSSPVPRIDWSLTVDDESGHQRQVPVVPQGQDLSALTQPKLCVQSPVKTYVDSRSVVVESAAVTCDIANERVSMLVNCRRDGGSMNIARLDLQATRTSTIRLALGCRSVVVNVP